MFKKFAAACGIGLLVFGISGCNPEGGRSRAALVGVNAPDTQNCQLDESPQAQGMPGTDRIFGWIEDLVNIGYRRTGTPAGYKAAEFVKCEFEKLGLEDVHYETATSWKWEATSASVQIDGQDIDAFPSAHSFVTPGEPSTFDTGPDGLEAEIVDVGLGTAPEMALKGVEGKVVLFNLKFILPTAGLVPFMEFLWDPALSIIEPNLVIANPYLTTYDTAMKAAMDAGAVGFIGVLSDYFDSNRYYNEFYRRTPVTIPGYWVSPKEGARIRQIMRASEQTAKANLTMVGSREEVEARSVIGFLPGKSKDTIMVQSHHDSVFYGAVEDGSGTASVLAQAQYFASQPAASREKTLMFATFDSHFTGYQSHQEFARKYIVDKETPYNIVANVTLEHIAKQGKTGPDGELLITDQAEVRGIMNNLGPTLKATMIDSLVRHDLRRTALLSAHALCATVGMPTDASFVCINGVPTASFIAGPNYLYDEADTLDKVAKEDLVPVAEVFSELIEAIDVTPPALIGLPVPSLGPSLDL